MEWAGTLLLVEDEHVLRNLVAEFLRGAGYEVREAADGPEGVAQFAEHGPFDLILLDIRLPGFSGVEVARQILRARPDQEILICSASILHETEDELIALGVDRFLSKPYHPEVLLAHIAGRPRARAAQPPRILPAAARH